MDIRVLQYFLAVAREESITKAAKALQMTQPPLSRQLKDLEEVGKQLLIRGSKKVTLTEDGMLLRKRAEEMIDLMEKTKAELSSSNENINGEKFFQELPMFHNNLSHGLQPYLYLFPKYQEYTLHHQIFLE